MTKDIKAILNQRNMNAHKHRDRLNFLRDQVNAN